MNLLIGKVLPLWYFVYNVIHAYTELYLTFEFYHHLVKEYHRFKTLVCSFDVSSHVSD